jgi:thiosulfate/3-mercaptopyruvate sulfurtransferase
VLDLRILDCTVFRGQPLQYGGGYVWVSGREAYEKGHIPGAVFADLVTDLSDPDTPLPLTRPSAERFAAAMARLGVGEGTRVVCYDANWNVWAARVWWLLRSFGFEDTAVLNGGWHKWTQEGRPVSTEPGTYPPGRFTLWERPELWADRDQVRSALGRAEIRVVNALPGELYRGEGEASFGRPGHIPASVSVPYREFTDHGTHSYLPADQIRAQFAAVGATEADQIITYCGSGISACSDALALTLIGVENIAVYDGSMMEWGADPSLPVVTGAAPGQVQA